MGCKGKELEAQRQQSREFAKCKKFDQQIAVNRAQCQVKSSGSASSRPPCPRR